MLVFTAGALFCFHILCACVASILPPGGGGGRFIVNFGDGGIHSGGVEVQQHKVIYLYLPLILFLDICCSNCWKSKNSCPSFWKGRISEVLLVLSFCWDPWETLQIEAE